MIPQLFTLNEGGNPLAVVIRLTRRGSKKKPFYRIVAADQRKPRDGKFLEVLGTYDPLRGDGIINIDLEKAQSWIKNGAQPSDTVANLIKRASAAPQEVSN